MFKSWRSEKKKIKAVFKLQFQATQVPKLKKPALIISLLPEDVGKTTFKLEKAPVQDGTCSWENPIYVTVKLIREPKTGKIHEKIYHFIVSSGSSKSGYLGEASIDFADFANEAEPFTVSLPLKFANSGAVLHVTIQKMQGETDQRHRENNVDPTYHQDGSLKAQMNNFHAEGNTKTLAEIVEQDGSFKGSVGSDGSFESTQRQNSKPPRETVDANQTKNPMHRRSSTDWSAGSVSDESLLDSSNSPEDNLPGASNEFIENLKSEIYNLKRQYELSELELQSLRKQVTKESRKVQDLSIQIVELKEERDSFKAECEQLKSSQKCIAGEALSQLRAENKDTRVQLEEIRHELAHEREVNNNLQMQLQKTQDSNSELILALRELDEMLDQKNMEISRLSNKLEFSKNVNELQEQKCESKNKEDQDQEEREDLTRGENDANEIYLLNQRITDLSDEIEAYKEGREQMEKYIEQLTHDYEKLKQEHHDLSSMFEQKRLQELKTQKESSEFLVTIKGFESQIQRLEEELKGKTQEFSESLVSINELETRVKGLEKELENQAQKFENDLDAMTHTKVEQEQRAICAEESLRKTRWKNAVTADHLQEEFRRLSVDMASKFDENEKLTMQSITEANELQVQKRILEERLQKTNEELERIKDQEHVKVEELSTQLDLKTKQVEQISLELEDKSKQLKYAQKHEKEKQDALSKEIQMLKTKIETLTNEKNVSALAQQAMKLREATKKMKTSDEESEMLTDRCHGERDDLGRKFSLARKETEQRREELLILSSSKNEKETMVKKLSSELESLRAQHMKLKNSLSKEELEKEMLQKQVLQLKADLRKEEESRSLEKNLNGQDAFADAKNLTSTENICIRDKHDLAQFLAEMKLVKEKNKYMERELKDMQERYSEISLKFAEVEGERQQLVMAVRNLKNGKKN